MNTVRKFAVRLGVAMVLVALALGSVPTVAQQPPCLDREEILRRLRSGTGTIGEQAEAMMALGSLAAADQANICRELVNVAPEHIAAEASMSLVQLRDGELCERVVPLLRRASQSSQSLVMQAVEHNGATSQPQDFLCLARAIVDSCLAHPSSCVADQRSPDPVGTAGVYLRNYGNSDDVAKMKRALRTIPSSSGLWFAAANAHERDDDLHQLAKSIFRDSTKPRDLRLAAAISISTIDSEAVAFVRQFIEEQVDPVWDKDVAAALQFLSIPNDPRGPYAAILALDERIRYLGLLHQLEADSAEQMTFRYIRSPNELVRKACATIGAMRWPARMVHGEIERLPQDERANFLALLLHFYPSYEEESRGLVPEAALSAARQSIRDGAMLSLSGPLPLPRN